MIKYEAKSEHIDGETGEVISKKNATQNYIKIKTEKRYDKQHLYTKDGYDYGTIITVYTTIYQKSKQIKIWT